MLPKITIFFNGNEYCLFIYGDAWLITKDGSCMYQCRKRTLAHPTTWTPPAVVVPYSELPDRIRQTLTLIQETEYYQPRQGDIYDG